jgi:hypothetical protein
LEILSNTTFPQLGTPTVKTAMLLFCIGLPKKTTAFGSYGQSLFEGFIGKNRTVGGVEFLNGKEDAKKKAEIGRMFPIEALWLPKPRYSSFMRHQRLGEIRKQTGFFLSTGCRQDVWSPKNKTGLW